MLDCEAESGPDGGKVPMFEHGEIEDDEDSSGWLWTLWPTAMIIYARYKAMSIYLLRACECIYLGGWVT
jgi:hypothetical protein